MTGFNLYYVARGTDEQTGEPWIEDAYFLQLRYSSREEAEAAVKVLETLYGTGNVIIDVQANYGTYMPGES